MWRVVARSGLSAFLLIFAAPAVSDAQLRGTLIVSGLSAPIAFVQDPADAAIQVIVQQAGRVRVLRDGVLQGADFLDLRNQIASGGEQGLLGFAFAPDFATSGRVFVSFTDRSGNFVLARFVRSPGASFLADPATRFDFLWPGGQRFVPHPFTNHNGGNLVFGPDGNLYVGMGDGGSGDDPFNNAQNPKSLLGKILRLNVQVPDADAEGYDVPGSNPFAGRQDVLGEIWALGVRNPWRWSFDDVEHGGTGALVMADVGQDKWEEIDYQPAAAGGRNYGWRVREGAHNNVTSLPAFSQPLVDPVLEYSHSVGQAIIGGFVYRGRALGSAYVGQYFFAEYQTSRIWSLQFNVNATTHEATAGTLADHSAEFGMSVSSPCSFGVDAAGELYIVNYGGTIFRIDPPAGQVPAPAPVTGARHHEGETVGKAKPR